MKYRKTRSWFKMRVIGWGPGYHEVQPFNAEKDKDHPDVSWSHGFTHFRDRSGRRAWCGQQYFEEKAVPIDKVCQH